MEKDSRLFQMEWNFSQEVEMKLDCSKNLNAQAGRQCQKGWAFLMDACLFSLRKCKIRAASKKANSGVLVYQHAEKSLATLNTVWPHEAGGASWSCGK